MTNIILERHGQSFGNKNKVLLGITDLSLTEEGILQAKITAEHLKNEKIDVIYSSDLKRAFETALPHAELRELEVKTSGALREVNLGVWDGKALDWVLAEYYEVFYNERPTKNFVYPGGESVRDAAERLYNEILRIAKENDGKTVLIVSHSVVIRSFWYHLCGHTEENMNDAVAFMENCAYARLLFDGETLVPVAYNVKEHLPPTDVKPI